LLDSKEFWALKLQLSFPHNLPLSLSYAMLTHFWEHAFLRSFHKPDIVPKLDLILCFVSNPVNK